MGIGHGPSRVFLRAAGRPADHFGNEILEAGRRYLVMGFVHGGVRVQTGVCHDAVDEVIDHHSDAVNSAEALIEAGLLWLCRHVSFPVCVWLCCFPKLVAAELVIRLNLFNLSPLTSADTCGPQPPRRLHLPVRRRPECQSIYPTNGPRFGPASRSHTARPLRVVQRAPHRLTTLVQHVRVDHRRAHVFVAASNSGTVRMSSPDAPAVHSKLVPHEVARRPSPPRAIFPRRHCRSRRQLPSTQNSIVDNISLSSLTPSFASVPWGGHLRRAVRPPPTDALPRRAPCPAASPSPPPTPSSPRRPSSAPTAAPGSRPPASSTSTPTTSNAGPTRPARPGASSSARPVATSSRRRSPRPSWPCGPTSAAMTPSSSRPRPTCCCGCG